MKKLLVIMVLGLLVCNIGLKHNFSKHRLILFNLDGNHSTQDTNSITGYIAMEFKF